MDSLPDKGVVPLPLVNKDGLKEELSLNRRHSGAMLCTMKLILRALGSGSLMPVLTSIFILLCVFDEVSQKLAGINLHVNLNYA